MEALQKRHDDFENSLVAQDERLKSFSEAADKLIGAKHYDGKKYDSISVKSSIRKTLVKTVGFIFLPWAPSFYWVDYETTSIVKKKLLFNTKICMNELFQRVLSYVCDVLGSRDWNSTSCLWGKKNVIYCFCFSINDRRNNVVQRRQNVKDLAGKRKATLTESHIFQEFIASIDDLRSWMGEKNRIVQDESFRDLNNLERKLQKHEAFERELRANEGRLRSINKVGYYSIRLSEHVK